MPVIYEYQYATSVEEMRRFVTECMVKAGTSPDHSRQLADLLIAADQRGHYSHGVNRLNIYFTDVKTTTANGDGTPKILKQKGSTAWVDGNNLLGAVVGNFCMDLAIKLAKEHGIGWVTAKNSNHFGIAGYYALKAAKQCLAGMSFTNGGPSTFLTRSAELASGNNPLSFIAEGKNGDNFALDMANSTVALGKVEIAKRLGQKEMLDGWGANKNGIPTRNPDDVLNGGGLVPLGCYEETGGYKGSGLCMMVDIMCGVMGGASFGKHVRPWRVLNVPANLGQCFIAIDPECFAPDFHNRLQQFIDETRELKPRDPELPVLVAGDPERSHIKTSEEHGGLVYPAAHVEFLNSLASEYGVKACTFKAINQ